MLLFLKKEISITSYYQPFLAYACASLLGLSFPFYSLHASSYMPIIECRDILSYVSLIIDTAVREIEKIYQRFSDSGHDESCLRL